MPHYLRHPLGGKHLATVHNRLAAVAGAVGLGLTAIIFARLGDWAQNLFLHCVAVSPYAPFLVTPLAFAAVVYVTRRWYPAARGSGIPQVMAVSHNPQAHADSELVSLKTAWAKLAGTIAMLLAGGSVGREGPTVQISAAVMVAVHRWLKVPVTAGVIIAGGAAGVAAAFNTPLAGVAFAIEELAAAFEQKVAVLVMAAVMISGLVSLGIAGGLCLFWRDERHLAAPHHVGCLPHCRPIGRPIGRTVFALPHRHDGPTPSMAGAYPVTPGHVRLALRDGRGLHRLGDPGPQLGDGL